MKQKEIKQSTIDALALEIMEDAKKDGEFLTLEDAQEMAVMEIKARDIKTYTKSDAPRKQTKRERKVDPDKKLLIGWLDDAICDFADNVLEVKNESEIHFQYNENDYTVKLIKHRPPKK